jgi:hypothetical protein
MNYINDISNLYFNLLEEGLDEKIPKLLPLVSLSVPDKEAYIRDAAAKYDPTPNAAYISWILRMLKQNKLGDDGEEIKTTLMNFDRLKQKPNFPKDKRDVNVYKSYDDLSAIVDQFKNLTTKGELKKRSREQGIDFIESSEGEEGVGYSLYIVTSEEAAAKHFRNTSWCVKDPKFFESQEPPYFYFTLNDKPHTLMSLGSGQCRDVNDRTKSLSSDELDLMQSEQVTDYILNQDFDSEAINYYMTEVGDGHDERIADKITGELESMIDEANKEFEIFTIEKDFYDGLKYFQATADGFISYDLSMYEDYIGDRAFLEKIEKVLDSFYLYPNDFIYNEPISEDLNGIRVRITSDKREPFEAVQDLIGDIESFERRYDSESFDEKFKEVMMKAGYLPTAFKKFSDKIDLDDLKFKNLKRDMNEASSFHRILSIDFPIQEEANIRRVKSSYIEKFKRNEHPYVLLAHFLKPLLDNGLGVLLDRNNITFQYEYPYHDTDDDRNQFDYMRELKMVKNFDEHFEFYIDQIQKFISKYVYPFMKNKEETGSYNIPEDIKLPIISIKTRKESGDQLELSLHEKVASFHDLCKVFELL